jgi:hypothetical protein
MWNDRSNCALLPLLLASLILFGCSSDGGGEASVAAPVYSGSTLPAAVTAASAATFGHAATEGVNEAVNLSKTGNGLPFATMAVEMHSTGSNALAQKVNDIATKVLDSSAAVSLPAAAVMSFDQLNAETGTNEFCGGSVAVPDNIDPEATLNFTMTFYDLCYDDGITPLIMDGMLTFTETETAFTIGFTNFSVTIDGKAESFTGTFTCDTGVFNCSIASDFAGTDGNIFRLENVDIDGDEFSGYILSADFYHYELGMVSITTDFAVTYGACGAFPDGGAISLAGAGGSSMSVSFNPDCSFSVEGFDGSSAFGPETLSWTL